MSKTECKCGCDEIPETPKKMFKGLSEAVEAYEKKNGDMDANQYLFFTRGYFAGVFGEV